MLWSWGQGQSCESSYSVSEHSPQSSDIGSQTCSLRGASGAGQSQAGLQVARHSSPTDKLNLQAPLEPQLPICAVGTAMLPRGFWA